MLKYYALKGWALNHAEKPKGLKPGRGNFKSFHGIKAVLKIQNFKHSDNWGLEKRSLEQLA